MFETFDHTADLGLRIQAESLNALFVESAQALFSVIVEDLSSIQTNQSWSLTIAGTDREYLLFDWLRELLYRFDAEQTLFAKWDVMINEQGLEATIWGQPLDPQRHSLSHEVKAITYHGLIVQQTDTGWLAEVIVDI